MLQYNVCIALGRKAVNSKQELLKLRPHTHTMNFWVQNKCTFIYHRNSSSAQEIAGGENRNK